MADYIYSDGNGNLYRVIDHKVTYEPVETINSSSGIYSGGDSWDAEITDQQLDSLVEHFTAAFKNRTFRAEKRSLGSAEIRMIEAGETFKVILAMRSPDKANIEQFFGDLH